MVPKLALLTNLLLASASLAVPSPSRLEARLARRRQNRQSRPLKGVDGSSGPVSNVQYSSEWAGVGISESSGTFTSITDTFTVPTVTGSSGSAVSIWIGIDGITCQTANLQAGVDAVVGGGYAAWYAWYPDYAYDFSGISIHAGDVIKATVTVNASSTTSGSATIENLTSGQTVYQELVSSYPLCQQDVEWIVEEYVGSGGLVDTADFGTIVITDATADGVYTPFFPGASVIEAQGVMAVAVNGSTIIVKYV